jgi:hypothetical protein
LRIKYSHFSIFPDPSNNEIRLFKRPDNYSDRGGLAEIQRRPFQAMQVKGRGNVQACVLLPVQILASLPNVDFACAWLTILK